MPRNGPSRAKRHNLYLKTADKDYLDNDEFLKQVEALAYEGYYDVEIADELRISRWLFNEVKGYKTKLYEVLKKARAQAKEDSHDEAPSPVRFAKVWATCDGKRSKLMEKFGVGWTKLQSWLAQDPRLVDIMAERDLKFLEQADTAGRILTLGAVKGKDPFPGWERHPDTYMMRWYFNTLGKRYGYGETPVMPEVEDAVPDKVEQGVDIESWLLKEMSGDNGENNGDTEVDDTNGDNSPANVNEADNGEGNAAKEGE